MVRGRDKHDHLTGDLLEWQPETVAAVPTYSEQMIRAATLRSKISKAVGATLREQESKREEIAEEMGLFLGEKVPMSTLNGYASEARADNSISVERMVALVHATGDLRLLSMIVEELGLVVIDKKFLPAIHKVLAAKKRAELDKKIDQYDHLLERLL